MIYIIFGLLLVVQIAQVAYFCKKIKQLESKPSQEKEEPKVTVIPNRDVFSILYGVV